MNHGRLHLGGSSSYDGELRGLRDQDGGAGRIYPVDPAAVARLKKILAEQEVARRRPRRQSAAATIGMWRRKQEKNDMPRGQNFMNDELARELHARAVAGESAGALAEEAGYAHQGSLSAYWRRLGLPSVREARKVAAAVEGQAETAVSEAAELPAALGGHDQAEMNRAEETDEALDVDFMEGLRAVERIDELEEQLVQAHERHESLRAAYADVLQERNRLLGEGNQGHQVRAIEVLKEIDLRLSRLYELIAALRGTGVHAKILIELEF